MPRDHKNNYHCNEDALNKPLDYTRFGDSKELETQRSFCKDFNHGKNGQRFECKSPSVIVPEVKNSPLDY